MIHLKSKTRKLLSLLLSIVMVIGLLPVTPVTAYGAEPEFYAVFSTAAEGTEGTAGYKPANTLSFYYDTNRESRTGTKYSLPAEAKEASDWGYDSIRGSVKNVVIDASVKDYQGLTSTAYMFKEMMNADDISGCENLNVSNVTNMRRMFYKYGGDGTVEKPAGSTTITAVPDVSKWKTGKVTDMNCMFYAYASNSTEITAVPDVSDWDTGNVTDMNHLFYRYACKSTGIAAVPDVSKWNTGNVTDMRYLFNGYAAASTSKLQPLDLSGWSIEALTATEVMFKDYAASNSQGDPVVYAKDWSAAKSLPDNKSKNMFTGSKLRNADQQTAGKDQWSCANTGKDGCFSTKPVDYIAADGSTKTITEYTLVDDQNFTWDGTVKDGWYVVNSNITVSQGYTVSGNVKLILADGYKLKVAETANHKAGICVCGSNTLSIYGQSDGEEAGQLEVQGGSNAAGIGGGNSGADKSGGNLTINGGKVTVTGGSLSAGIGGGYGSSGINITVNGGTVTAAGAYNAAGIGGGYGGSGNNITINGGTVTAVGYNSGAGIGGGSGKNGTDIYLNGGTVTATGGNSGGAGIGGGNIATGNSVYAEDCVVVKAGTSADPTAKISHTSSSVNIAGDLSGKKYVTAVKVTQLTVAGATVLDKTYDGTTAATLSTVGTLEGIEPGDTVEINTAAAAFDNKNAGEDKAVTVTYTLKGKDAGKYTVADVSDLTAAILPKQLEVTGTTVDDKVYDGTAAATVHKGTVAGIASGDTVEVTAAGTFADAEIGDNKEVTITYSLSGTDSDNYIAPETQTSTASITAEAYTVTCSPSTNGSVTSDKTTAEPGAAVTLTVTPETGYELDVLTVIAGETPVAVSSDNSFTMPAANVTVSAEFREKAEVEFTVTFDLGGKGENFTRKVASGSNAKRPADPACTRWSFVDWFRDAAKTIEWIFDGEAGADDFKILRDTAIYGKWEKEVYTAGFNANGGSGSMDDIDTVDWKLTLPANEFTAPEGKKFAGWGVGSKMGGAKAPGTEVELFEDTVVYAMWEEIAPPAPTEDCTVRFDFESEAAKTRTVKAGTAITLPTVSKEGSAFKGWAIQKENGEFDPQVADSPYEVTEDVLFHAIFAQVKKIDGKDVDVVTISNEVVDESGAHADEKEAKAAKELADSKSVAVSSNVLDAVKSEALKTYAGCLTGTDSMAFGLKISLNGLSGFDTGSSDEKCVSYEVKPWVSIGNSELQAVFREVENNELNGKKITFRLAVPSEITEKFAAVDHIDDAGKQVETLYLPIKTVVIDSKTEKYVEAAASQFSHFVLTFVNKIPPVIPEDDDSTFVAKPVRTGTWGDPVTDGTWSRDSDGRWMYRTNAYFKNTWGYIRNPYAKAGQPADGWFWFDENGRMAVGWKQIGGKWYYLNPTSDGTLGMCFLDTTTPDGCKVDKNGAWIR